MCTIFAYTLNTHICTRWRNCRRRLQWPHDQGWASVCMYSLIITLRTSVGFPQGSRVSVEQKILCGSGLREEITVLNQWRRAESCWTAADIVWIMHNVLTYTNRHGTPPLHSLHHAYRIKCPVTTAAVVTGNPK